VAQTAQGYGFIDSIPAFYGLWWLDSELIRGYERMGLGGPKIPTILTGGFSSLWRNVYYQNKLNVEFNVKITAIRRNTDGKLPRIQIDYTQNGHDLKNDYDWLFVAAPWKDIVPLFTNPTPFELEVAQALNPLTIITHLIDASDSNNYAKDDEAVLTWPSALVESSQGHVYTVRNTAKAIMDRTYVNLPKGRFSYVTYQLWNRTLSTKEQEESTSTMKEDLTKYGMSNFDVIAARPRAYFYHFGLEAISVKQYPWKILEYQGNLSTIFIGASVSFESMNDVINYNLMLKEHYLKFT